MNPQDKDIIEKAKHMLHRHEPAQKESIKSELESLFQKGSPYAHEAVHLLARLEESAAKQDPHFDQLIAALKNEGLVFHAPDDGRLADYLTKLVSQPVKVQKRLGQVYTVFREWFQQAVHKEEQRYLTQLEQVAQTLAKLPGLDSQTKQALSAFRSYHYKVTFEKTEQTIHRALAEWNLPRAWQAFADIELAPDDYQVQVKKVRETILAVGNRYDQATLLLERKHPTKKGWSNMGLAVEHWQDLDQLTTQKGLPTSWQKRLNKKQDDIGAAIQNFLMRKAQSISTASDLSRFNDNYKDISGLNNPAVIDLQVAWFDKATQLWRDRLQQAVAAVRSPKDLERKLRELSTYLNQFPDKVVSQLKPELSTVQELREGWRNLLSGHDIREMDSTALQEHKLVPTRMEQDMQRYMDWLNQIQTLREQLQADEYTQAQVNATFELAEEILSEVPEHREAKSLQDLAEKLSTTRDMDNALKQLDVERFLQLAEHYDGKDAYQILAKQPKGLQLLKQAINERIDFTNITQVANWLDLWQEAISLLPEAQPVPLRERVITARLSQQIPWHKALNTLERKQYSFDFWQDLLDILEPCQEEFNLQDYCRRFQRWARLAKINALIKDKEWDAAEEEIKGLAAADEDRPRLSVEVKLKKAEDQGLGQLAKELLQSWSTITRFHDSELMLGKLQDCLLLAWRTENNDALRDLRSVTDRVLQDGSMPESRLKPLNLWRDLIRLEPTLTEAAFQSSDLLELYEVYKAGKKYDFVLMWLAKLAEKWHADPRHFVVPSIWYQRIFSKDPILSETLDEFDDPLKHLMHRTQRVAEEVTTLLGSDALPAKQALVKAERNLETETADWNRLRNYLNAIPKQVSIPKPPPILKESTDHVQDFREALNTLEALQAADLRVAETNYTLAELYSRLGDLKQAGFQIANELRDRVGFLQEIAEAKFHHDQLLKHAAQARDDQFLNQKNMFGQLAEKLEELHDFFSKRDALHLGFWDLLRGECLARTPIEAGFLQDIGADADYAVLIQVTRKVQEDEDFFRMRLAKLKEMQPEGNDIDPEKRGDYLQLFPEAAPLSRRTFYLFHQYAHMADVKRKLKQARNYLHGWIQEYLERGLPW